MDEDVPTSKPSTNDPDDLSAYKLDEYDEDSGTTG